MSNIPIRPLAGERERVIREGQTTYNVVKEPPIVEHVEKPAVVHEVIRPEERIEIQPVIEREREQLEVHHVVQPMRERDILPTEVMTKTLPAEVRPEIRADDTRFRGQLQQATTAHRSTVEIEAPIHERVERAPIVREHIHQRVIEEIQPVIYKEVERPILIKETVPIVEKVIEEPHAHMHVLPTRDLGTHMLGGTQYREGMGTMGSLGTQREGMPHMLSEPQILSQGGQSMGQGFSQVPLAPPLSQGYSQGTQSQFLPGAYPQSGLGQGYSQGGMGTMGTTQGGLSSMGTTQGYSQGGLGSMGTSQGYSQGYSQGGLGPMGTTQGYPQTQQGGLTGLGAEALKEAQRKQHSHNLSGSTAH